MNEFTLHVPGVEPDNIDESRMMRIMTELSHALRQTDHETLKAWAIVRGNGCRSASAPGQRIRRLAGKLVYAGIAEGGGLASAVRAGRGLEQLGDRSAAAIDASISFAQGGKLALKKIRQALRDDPQRNIPRLVAGVLGFHAGSGGLDGNGGIPDLDLAAGIGFHRSLLTHSILAGVLAEGLLVAIVDLSGEIKDRLPEVHYPLWDKLAEAAGPLASPLLAGTSAGIAYHLLVDATLQPTAYHGLPSHMPMQDHELAMGANGVRKGHTRPAWAGNTELNAAMISNAPRLALPPGEELYGIAQAASKAIHPGRSWLERP